jgi:hypothetical protein
MYKTRSAAGTLGAALLVAVAMFACGGRTADLGGPGGSSGGGSGGSGSGSGGNGFPFSGPTCSNIPGGCWSCLQSNCPNLGCLTSDCSTYLTCYCACALGDQQCYSGCQSDVTPACASCAQSIGQCTQSCQSQCSVSGGGGGTGSSTGGGFGGSSNGGMGGGSGGGFGGSSSGPGSSETCTGSAQQCASGGYLQFCQDYSGSTCTGAHYTITSQQGGAQQFPCASCNDTSVCQKEATAACQ